MYTMSLPCSTKVKVDKHNRKELLKYLTKKKLSKQEKTATDEEVRGVVSEEVTGLALLCHRWSSRLLKLRPTLAEETFLKKWMMT